MTDPQFAVGDHVLFHGQPAVIESHGFEDPPDGPRRFIGYELTFPDGSFSGWHPEDQIRKVDA